MYFKVDLLQELTTVSCFVHVLRYSLNMIKTLIRYHNQKQYGYSIPKFSLSFYVCYSFTSIFSTSSCKFCCVCEDDEDSSSPSSNSICRGESSKMRFNRPSPTFKMNYEMVVLCESRRKLSNLQLLNSVLCNLLTYLTKLFFFTFKGLQNFSRQ